MGSPTIFLSKKVVTNTEELISLILIAEILRTSALILLIFCSAFYLRHLAKMKKQRKLTPSEFAIYIIFHIAYLAFAMSLLIFIFVD